MTLQRSAVITHDAERIVLFCNHGRQSLQFSPFFCSGELIHLDSGGRLGSFAHFGSDDSRGICPTHEQCLS